MIEINRKNGVTSISGSVNIYMVTPDRFLYFEDLLEKIMQQIGSQVGADLRRVWMNQRVRNDPSED